jgi:hypothetical protein
MRQLLWAILASGAVTASLFVSLPAGEQSAAPAFTQLVDEYFDYFFRHNPTRATNEGVHDFDHLIDGYTRTDVESEVTATRQFLNRFEAIDPAKLTDEMSSDREMVVSHLRATLLELEEVRSWERDPDYYSSGATRAVFGLISRQFAPPAERLKSVIARERRIPAVFEAARENLKRPPRVYTEIALEELPGIIRFFEKDVPAAFEGVRDEKLLDEFVAANQAVIDAIGQYERFLKETVLPRSDGDFRIGAELFRKKLLFEEMIDTPLDELLRVGYADLRANQRAFTRTAAEIDPKRTPQEVMAELEREHPAPEKLLDSFRDVVGGLRNFCEEHKIVTFPSPVPPTIAETPPFMRALSFASMDTPGPFEPKATEAYFNVTLPEPHWPKERVEEHMAAFNYGTIVSTAIHEAYPGHYTQFLWVQRAPSKVRKILGCSSNSEGWAHYTEQMMFDEGYGRGDLKLRLGQLQDALLRNCRFVVGIEMHTGKMSFDKGVDFFVREGFQTRTNAERETKRGTADPTYLVYTLGKLEILRLRDDYRKLRGDAFTLQEFHDALLKQGYPPIKLVRRSLLKNEK